MKKLKLLTLTLMLLTFFSAKMYSQESKGTINYTETSVVMSMDEIVQYNLLHPSDSTPKMKKDRPEKYIPNAVVDESRIIYNYGKTLEPGTANSTKDPSPLPDDDFLALGDEGSSIPPDVNGTAGPNHLMVTLNTEVRIMTRTGTPISTVTLGNFFSGLPGASGTFDPKIEYDPYEDRWIVTCVSSSNPSSSRLLMAVSESSDPTGNWYKYAIDADPNNSGWMDYPNLGFNKHWVVVSGNMFSSGGSFQNNVFFVIKKSDLINGFPTVQYTRLTSSITFTIVPAITYDPDLDDIFLLSALNNFTSSFLAKFKISGDIGSEVLSFQGYINAGASNTWAYAVGGGDFTPQLGSSQNINHGDGRMGNVVYRNGKLWATHHVFLPSSNPNRSVAQWWEISASNGAILQLGRVDEPNMHFTYPNIAVNAMEEVLLGYCSSSSSQYSGASYSFRSPDDPDNTMKDRYQYVDGKAKYYKTFGGGANRWGDYTACDVDPVNDLNFWTIQDYAELPTGNTDHWGTWWAMLLREAQPIAAFSADQELIAIDGSVNFTDESLFDPTSWSWTFDGGTPSTSTEQNPENIVYSAAGNYDVTLTVTNGAGSNTLTLTDYIEVNSSILPEPYFMATDSVPCVGNSIQLIDQSLYNPTSWSWTITPGTFEYVDGSSSASQNPSVQFNEVGQYTVALSATNDNGSNSVTLTDYICTGGYEMPFMEHFENGLLPEMGWTIDNPDEAITWDVKAVDGNTPGFMSAYINLKDYLVVGQKDGLISPPLNFMGYISVILNFQHAYAERLSASSDSLNIYVSADCGNSWTKVFGVTEDGEGSFATHEEEAQTVFVPQSADDWCGSGFGADCYSLDISQYAWQYDVRIKFESVTGYGNGLYIDNLSFDLITGMPDNAASLDKIQIFPNPTTGEINVSISEVEHTVELQVLSITGKLVEKHILQASSSDLTTKIDLSDQPKGIYFIRITNDDYNHVEKVILK